MLACLLARLRVWLACVGLAFALGAATPSSAAPGGCTGHFVNPITDVCWSCLFPLSVGGLEIWPSERADTPNPSFPICLCGSPIPRIGIAVGFWEPSRLVDVSNKPWCFVNLGGMTLDPGFDIGRGTYQGTSQIGGASQQSAKWNVHWYMYPLVSWLEILADFACLEVGTFDIAYVTEIDPLWQDDSLTTLINPESTLFANPVAQIACAADCIASTANIPLDPLFWCAGCHGSMYPLNGNVSAHMDPIQSSRLAAERMIYKLHREGILWGTAGGAALCHTYPMPILKKSQYRLQMTNPAPMVSGKFACPTIGSSTLNPATGRTYPVEGEDMGYLVWRKRNCCAL